MELCSLSSCCDSILLTILFHVNCYVYFITQYLFFIQLTAHNLSTFVLVYQLCSKHMPNIRILESLLYVNFFIDEYPLERNLVITNRNFRFQHKILTKGQVWSILPVFELLPLNFSRHRPAAWQVEGSDSNAGKMDQTWSTCICIILKTT